MVKDDHIPGDWRAIDQPASLAMKGMGNLQIEPYRAGAGEDNVVAIAG